MQPPQRLSWFVEVHGDGVFVIAAGEFDDDAGEAFARGVDGVLTGRPELLVLDLTAVQSISTEGTVMLVDVVYRAAATCMSVTILPSPAVRRQLDLLDPDNVSTDHGPDPATSTQDTPLPTHRGE